jgi:uncharacterized membrane protein YhaH (DUF805 family)
LSSRLPSFMESMTVNRTCLQKQEGTHIGEDIPMAVENVNPYAAPKSKLANESPIDDANWFVIYLLVLKRYAAFNGRAQRKEYWVFTLISTLVAIFLLVIGAAIGVKEVLKNVYNLGVLVPSIAVGVRRMHDTNRSGWWLLMPFANIVFLCFDSQPGQNRFGPNPKEGPGDGSQAASASEPYSSGEKYIYPVGRSGWAIAAGYLALFSVLLFPAPFALFCGLMALKDISRNPKKLGKPRAIFGIVMGVLGTLVLLLILATRH